jgi:hypothetical protein
MIWIAVLFFSSVNLDLSSSLQCIKAQSSKLKAPISKLDVQSSKLKALAAADDS